MMLSFSSSSSIDGIDPITVNIGPRMGMQMCTEKAVQETVESATSSGGLLAIASNGGEAVSKKTAHEISHERAEMRHRSRIPAWQQQQQQQEQEQEPVTSSSDQQTAMSSIIACLGRQQCDRIRRCVLGRLSQQKHVERHVRGRRGVCRPSTAADHGRRPVAVTDDWPAAAARFRELLRNDNIQQLERYVAELRKHALIDKRSNEMSVVRRLHPRHHYKRVFVYARGQLMDRFHCVFGDCMERLLTEATSVLRMDKPAKYLFTVGGTPVEEFDSVNDNEILCASTVRRATRSFVYPLSSCQATEIKARWGRARRLYGRHVTNYVIEPPSNLYATFVAAPPDCSAEKTQDEATAAELTSELFENSL